MADDDDRLARADRRGAHAEALISDPLLNESLAKLEAAYAAAWKDSEPRDTEGRERLWQAVQIVGKVKNHLSKVANDGVVARKEIDQIARLGERRKLFGVV